MQTYKSAKRQQGVTLIVTLIILVAMTTLGLSSIRSTSIQQAIIKNTQFLMSVRNVAKTEINGQLDTINNNADSAGDPILQTIIDQGVDTVYEVAHTGESNDSELTTPAYLKSTYSQRVTMTMNCRSCPAPSGGFSYGLGIAALTATISSTAALDDSAATSTQEQGYWYLVPAAQ
jgi:Tfp pilus assembly protein PilX